MCVSCLLAIVLLSLLRLALSQLLILKRLCKYFTRLFCLFLYAILFMQSAAYLCVISIQPKLVC